MILGRKGTGLHAPGVLSPSGVFHPPEQNYLSGTPHLKRLPSTGSPPRLSEKERSQTQILCQAADPVRIQHLFGFVVSLCVVSLFLIHVG